MHSRRQRRTTRRCWPEARAPRRADEAHVRDRARRAERAATRVVPEMAFEKWYGMLREQMPTVLALLTDEYQKRMVQQFYHEGNTNAAQWPGQYCWPEGFMRRWYFAGTQTQKFMVTPTLVQMMAGIVG